MEVLRSGELALTNESEVRAAISCLAYHMLMMGSPEHKHFSRANQSLDLYLSLDEQLRLSRSSRARLRIPLEPAEASILRNALEWSVRRSDDILARAAAAEAGDGAFLEVVQADIDLANTLLLDMAAADNQTSEIIPPPSTSSSE